MNRDIALRDGDRGWEVGPHLGAPLPSTEQASQPAIDLARLLRILHHWRWLILGATLLGLLLGVIATLLTTPLYRADVTLEVSPPRVEIMDGENEDRSPQVTNWDFIATQVGLLKSDSLSQRVAEDLNLAGNPKFADQSAAPAARLRQASRSIASNLAVEMPEEGQLIRFSYVSDSPQLAAQIANAYADAFSIRRSSGDMTHPLTPARSCSGRSTRRAQTSRNRSDSSSPTPSRKASSTRAAAKMASRAATPARSRASRWSSSTRRWPRRPLAWLPRMVPIGQPQRPDRRPK